MPDREDAVVTAMLDPGFYPHRPAAVELRETHASWVFLADELAYKVKKPIVLPFLDYGTVERRLEMCREEVRLNARLAPDLYLGVDSIVRSGASLALAPEGAPGAVEHAVRMRRVPEHRTLARLIERGRVAEQGIEAVARRIARFHAAADEAPAEYRELSPLDVSLRENVATLEDAGTAVLSAPRLLAARRFTEAYLLGARAALERRAADGWIRDCHGDLRAEHVILGDPVAVYDCVEFNPAFRYIDVGADLAFLVMDCSRLGRDDLADHLVRSYREAGGDPGPAALLSFYAAYRAWVRAKVACVRAAELSERDRKLAASEREAREMVDLGHRFAWRARLPLVIAVCGLSGSGKTTLADRIADVSGLAHLGSDPVRKRLAGIAPHERASERYYSEEFSRRTYSDLGRLAARELESCGGVIVDATFLRRAHRDAFREALDAPDVPILFAECRAPRPVLVERTKRRAAQPGQVSDAGPEIVERQLAVREPLEEASGKLHATISTDGPLEDALAELESAADRAVWERD